MVGLLPAARNAVDRWAVTSTRDHHKAADSAYGELECETEMMGFWGHWDEQWLGILLLHITGHDDRLDGMGMAVVARDKDADETESQIWLKEPSCLDKPARTRPLQSGQ